MKYCFVVLALLFLHHTELLAQEEKSIFDYLSGEEVVELIIEANFDSIIANKYTADYRDATLQIKGDEQIWDIEIKTRGRYRRRICDFPPMKLEFSKKDLAEEGMTRYDDLKLVTHCLDNAQSDSYVLREALTYGMYQILTPISFRHQVVRITYVNTGKRRYKIKRYGILIEDEKDLASRLNGMSVDTFGLHWDSLDNKSIELAATYQYMIGNSDWDIPMQRNLKFVQLTETGEILAVPYDFDMSGIVNPIYGIPNPDLPITSLQDRYYMGLNKPSETSIALLKAKKEELLDYCKDYKLLNNWHRSEIRTFMESFYEELEKGTAFINEEAEGEKGN